MKVILKEDLESLGSKGDIVKVANGYARNYLIPRGLAEVATSSNLKRLDEAKKAYQRKSTKLLSEAEKLAKNLETLECIFTRKASEDEKLFGSVTSMDIEAYLKEKGYSIDRKYIILKEPIKKPGNFTVPIRLHPGVMVDLKVSVVKEEERGQA